MFFGKTNAFYGGEGNDQVNDGAVEYTDGFPMWESGFQVTDVSGMGHWSQSENSVKPTWEREWGVES